MTEWNPTLYDNKHTFVSNFGDDLVSSLKPQKGEKILDLGCGTGDLAYKISKSGAIVWGIDAAHSMIEAAKEKYPEIQFSVQDGQQLESKEHFHAVFSNAALHWMKDQQKVIQNCYNALLPHGRFIAELGGAHNIETIIHAIEEASNHLSIPYEPSLFPWVFPTKEEMEAHLLKAGFRIISIEHYNRPTPLDGEEGIHNWLKMFSNNLFIHMTNKEKEAIYKQCENILRPKLYKEKEWVADYWRLRFIAVKET
ncbi:class I SAM-dependent methyltransferase [Alkalihalobacillus pseudalcaliphilus]|uniref:class I SAM-dependent methyltransferase n=1 Tax=Alkalihalobacillus pseudalcaliphilus TaxID=79884 RepID=UPI000A4BBA59|nr:class I SAM-dependent methyltransferase [Alkalihalobacillus pseudalcaliphilus]